MDFENMVDETLEYYEMDDGPLTPSQLQRIDEINTCKDISEEEVINRLF